MCPWSAFDALVAEDLHQRAPRPEGELADALEADDAHAVALEPRDQGRRGLGRAMRGIEPADAEGARKTRWIQQARVLDGEPLATPGLSRLSTRTTTRSCRPSRESFISAGDVYGTLETW